MNGVILPLVPLDARKKNRSRASQLFCALNGVREVGGNNAEGCVVKYYYIDFH
jgi:hypothetical protein